MAKVMINSVKHSSIIAVVRRSKSILSITWTALVLGAVGLSNAHALTDESCQLAFHQHRFYTPDQLDGVINELVNLRIRIDSSTAKGGSAAIAKSLESNFAQVEQELLERFREAGVSAQEYRQQFARIMVARQTGTHTVPRNIEDRTKKERSIIDHLITPTLRMSIPDAAVGGFSADGNTYYNISAGGISQKLHSTDLNRKSENFAVPILKPFSSVEPAGVGGKMLMLNAWDKIAVWFEPTSQTFSKGPVMKGSNARLHKSSVDGLIDYITTDGEFFIANEKGEVVFLVKTDGLFSRVLAHPEPNQVALVYHDVTRNAGGSIVGITHAEYRLYDTSSRVLLQSFKIEDVFQDILSSENNKYLVATYSSEARVYDRSTGELVSIFTYPIGFYAQKSVLVANDSIYLLAFQNGVLKGVDSKTGKVVTEITIPKGATKLTASPDGKRFSLLVGSELYIYDL